MKRIKSHEERKILLLGETLRENPRTILLSIPIFIVGFIFYSMIGDREGKIGSYGHCGITFKNYHRHYWQKDFLMKIAFYLFDKSSKHASGEGKISSLLHCGKAALSLKDTSLALQKYNEALKGARKIKHVSIEGNIYNHLAAVEIDRGNLKKAKEYLDKSHKILVKAAKDKSKSLYIQVWLTGCELTMSEYWLAKGDRDLAKIWAMKAERRSEKYDLKTRKIDAKKLLKSLKLI